LGFFALTKYCDGALDEYCLCNPLTVRTTRE
jgi:hypothetical protein